MTFRHHFGVKKCLIKLGRQLFGSNAIFVRLIITTRLIKKRSFLYNKSFAALHVEPRVTLAALCDLVLPLVATKCFSIQSL